MQCAPSSLGRSFHQSLSLMFFPKKVKVNDQWSFVFSVQCTVILRLKMKCKKQADYFVKFVPRNLWAKRSLSDMKPPIQMQHSSVIYATMNSRVGLWVSISTIKSTWKETTWETMWQLIQTQEPLGVVFARKSLRMQQRWLDIPIQCMKAVTTQRNWKIFLANCATNYSKQKAT